MGEKSVTPELQAEVRQQLISAEKQGEGALWKVYSGLIDNHLNRWEYLCAISMTAEERIIEIADEEICSAYWAMMDMVECLAARHLEDPEDYHAFREQCGEWSERIWRALPW